MVKISGTAGAVILTNPGMQGDLEEDGWEFSGRDAS